MTPRTSFPAAPESSEPRWIFRSPRVPTRSTPAAKLLLPRSFDVLHLFPQFFDFGFDFQREAGNRQRFALYAGSFGEHGIGFAVHFLEQKIKFLAEFAGIIHQLGKLLQVAAQAVEFFADVAAFRQ